MKKLRTILIVFVLILTVSIAYAAASGSFDIDGTVNLGGVKLEANNFSTTDEITWNAKLDGSGFDVVVDFAPTQTTAEFTFNLVNNGADGLDYTIGAVTYKVGTDGDAEDEILVTIADGGTGTVDSLDYVTITVTIDRIGTGVGEFGFSFTIGYELA